MPRGHPRASPAPARRRASGSEPQLSAGALDEHRATRLLVTALVGDAAHSVLDRIWPWLGARAIRRARRCVARHGARHGDRARRRAELPIEREVEELPPRASPARDVAAPAVDRAGVGQPALAAGAVTHWRLHFGRLAGLPSAASPGGTAAPRCIGRTRMLRSRRSARARSRQWLRAGADRRRRHGPDGRRAVASADAIGVRPGSHALAVEIVARLRGLRARGRFRRSRTRCRVRSRTRGAAAGRSCAQRTPVPMLTAPAAATASSRIWS